MFAWAWIIEITRKTIRTNAEEIWIGIVVAWKIVRGNNEASWKIRRGIEKNLSWNYCTWIENHIAWKGAVETWERNWERGKENWRFKLIA